MYGVDVNRDAFPKRYQKRTPVLEYDRSQIIQLSEYVVVSFNKHRDPGNLYPPFEKFLHVQVPDFVINPILTPS